MSEPLAEHQNESFLSDLTSNPAADREREVREMILGSEQAAHLRAKFEGELRLNEVESKRQYGLMGPYAEREFTQRVRTFSEQEVVRGIQRYQTRKQIRAAREAARRDEILSSKPVAAAISVAAVGTGSPVEVQINDSTTIHARTDLTQSKGQLVLNSPVVEGWVDIDQSKPSSISSLAPVMADPTQPVADPSQGKERVRVSIAKQVPFLGVRSGLAYGTSSQTVSASLSKPLSDNLTCVLDTVRSVDASANPGSSEERVKLLYGIRF